MVRKIIVSFLILGLGVFANANNLETFLGFGYSGVDTDIKWWTNDGNSLQGTQFVHGLYIRGGVILDKTHRFSAEYSYMGKNIKTNAGKNKFKLQEYLAYYDYLFPVGNEAKFYLGAHLGGANGSLKGANGLLANGKHKLSGFAYGAQAGFIYDIDQNLEFEIGAKITDYSAKKTIHDGTDWDKYKLKPSVGFLAGVNYKF